MRFYEFHVYITTNPTKTVLYTGFTNNLPERLTEHYDERGKRKTFAGRYNCYNLIFSEEHFDVNVGIYREKEIKGWSRAKKIKLIESKNPEWRFLNIDLMKWPPDENAERRDKKED